VISSAKADPDGVIAATRSGADVQERQKHNKSAVLLLFTPDSLLVGQVPAPAIFHGCLVIYAKYDSGNEVGRLIRDLPSTPFSKFEDFRSQDFRNEAAPTLRREQQLRHE
jgi:hypothetical protein